ncbi:MAG: Fic family protein [Gammaproteobacteria bacterium]|nr:Fic family protein [Gammaproteobacteria bacterium]
MQREAGNYVEAYIQHLKARAFIPYPLPPQPAIEWTPTLAALRDEANQCLGRLDGIARVLPEKHLFLYQYVRKEAVLSSQIEGTQSSLRDLLMFELDEVPGVPMDDVREVSNYVAALDHGMERIRRGERTISLGLLHDMHAILLRDGRGVDKSPGRLRDRQVFIGSANPPRITFVPPPPDHVELCLTQLDAFLNNSPEHTPALLKAALAHVQFETIHPYRDGNGRLGRLLITLLLCAEGALSEPLLYLSLYFKQNRSAYYDQLQRVRTHGDWEAWLEFFLVGVRDTAQSAVKAAERMLNLFRVDRERIQTLGRGAGSALRVHQLLQQRPVLSIPNAATRLAMSWPAIDKAVRALEKLGLLREFTGKKRNRLYLYDAYFEILTEGTEPLPR